MPPDTPVLYIGHHRSFFDVPITYPRCPIRTGYIAKKEMEKVPLLSTWMKRLHCLFLDRSDLKAGMKTILAAIEEIKNGVSICIFPEGTRSKMGNEMLEFKGGSFKAATKAKCPIVPVTLIDSFKPFDTNSIAPVTVQVHFLKPLYYDDYKDMKTNDIAELVRSQIQKTIHDSI